MLIQSKLNRRRRVVQMRGRGIGRYVATRHRPMHGDGFLDSLKGFGRRILGGIKSAGRALWGSAKASAKTAAKELGKKGQELAKEAIKEAAKSAGQVVRDKGADVIDSLVAGDRERAKQLLKEGGNQLLSDAKQIGLDKLDKGKEFALGVGKQELANTKRRVERKVMQELAKNGLAEAVVDSGPRSNNILDLDGDDQLALLNMMNGSGMRRRRGGAIKLLPVGKPKYKLLGSGLQRM